MLTRAKVVWKGQRPMETLFVIKLIINITANDDLTKDVKWRERRGPAFAEIPRKCHGNSEPLSVRATAFVALTRLKSGVSVGDELPCSQGARKGFASDF